MKRWALLIGLLTVSLWTFAQTVGPYGAVPVNTSTGTAYISAPASQPLLVAPQAHLGTAAPVVGATSATPGNMAGAVSSTMAELPPSPVVPIVPQFYNGVPVVVMPEPAAGAPPLLQPAAGLTVSGTINPGVAFNTGVGSSSGVYQVGSLAENQTSLGEIAREYRNRKAAEQARTYTNEDIQHMNQSRGVSVVGGVSGTAVSPGAPGTATQPAGTAPAVAQPGTTSPPAAPGVATPVPPQPQTNPSQPPPMSQMQSSNPMQMAQAMPPSGMQQMRAAPARPKRPSQPQQLPSASSVLPLMALVGFLAATAGLMAR